MNALQAQEQRSSVWQQDATEIKNGKGGEAEKQPKTKENFPPYEICNKNNSN